MARTILVVDDERTLRETLAESLETEGFSVVQAADGREAVNAFRRSHPDLILLDLMLPELSGTEVCRIIRSESGVPILMLTAKNAELDKVVGLELGADDYVTKPFEPREVVARVGAILRRFGRPAASQTAGAAAEIPTARTPASFFDLTIDVEDRDVSRAGASLPLTRTELDVLAALAEQPGRVWTREQIGQRVFGESFDTFDRTIDSHVKNLRAKLGSRPDGGSYVETVRGVGYRAARPTDSVRPIERA
jgi:two-component system OmpR family response regulator